MLPKIKKSSLEFIKNQGQHLPSVHIPWYDLAPVSQPKTKLNRITNEKNTVSWETIYQKFSDKLMGLFDGLVRQIG